MTIPFVDLKLQYEILRPHVDERVLACLRESEFVKGPATAEFERQWGEYLQHRHVVTTGNGTDALYIALKVLGTTAGDEIITPAFSWISSAETISLCHATPVFADIDPVTYTLTAESVAARITPRTKGLIAVHLYGQMAPMAALRALCDKRGLFLIEDCAQAHLSAEQKGFAGTWGDMAAFSFYPTKNLGAYGDAGCVVTGDALLAEKARRYANHGALQKDDHLVEGINSRMDTLQAAILLVKLSHLQAWNAQRIDNARRYTEALQNIEGIVAPYVRPDTVHTFHIYAVRARYRDRLKEYLGRCGIQTVVHYPSSLPNLPAYRHLQHHPQDFPVASNWQTETLSLPIYPELTHEQILYVCKNIRDFYVEHSV